MQNKSSAHTRHKNAHFKKALEERLKLQIKSLNDILSSANFDSTKYGNLELLISCVPNVDEETKVKLESCLEKIKSSKEFEDIKLGMEDCLGELSSKAPKRILPIRKNHFCYH